MASHNHQQDLKTVAEYPRDRPGADGHVIALSSAVDIDRPALRGVNWSVGLHEPEGDGFDRLREAPRCQLGRQAAQVDYPAKMSRSRGDPKGEWQAIPGSRPGLAALPQALRRCMETLHEPIQTGHGRTGPELIPSGSAAPRTCTPRGPGAPPQS